MRRSMVWGLLLALVAGAGTAQAQDRRPGLAVLPFDNGGSFGREKEDFDALRVGIQGMMIADLSQNPAVRLVDRSQIQQILHEQDLGANGRVDAMTAAKVGKLVGARYMIFGDFLDVYGKFRLNARIVDVETGEIMKVVSNTDPKLQNGKDLFRIIEVVADGIMKDTKLPPLPAAVGAAMRQRNVPTEAIALYSRALLYQDRGDKAKATEYYERAIKAFPDYTEAKEGLKKIRPS